MEENTTTRKDAYLCCFEQRDQPKTYAAIRNSGREDTRVLARYEKISDSGLFNMNQCCNGFTGTDSELIQKIKAKKSLSPVEEF